MGSRKVRDTDCPSVNPVRRISDRLRQRIRSYLYALLWLVFAQAAFTLAPDQAFAQYTFHYISAAPDSGIEVEMVSAFDSMPLRGYLPVRLRLRNRSGSRRSWTLNVATGSSSSWAGGNYFAKTLSVENGVERVMDIMVPLGSSARWGHYGRFELSGYGLSSSSGTFSGHYGGYSSSATPFLAMSKAVSARSWRLLEDYFTTAKQQYSGSAIDLSLLPADWRALTSLDQLWMSESEWRDTLTAGQRTTILDWVLQGGKLFLCTQRPSDFESEDFDFSSGEGTSSPIGEGVVATERYGLGQAILYLWDGSEVTAANVAAQYENQTREVARREGEYGKSSWELLKTIEEIQHRAGLILVLMALYAFLVGPYNIFVLAGRQNRARLFVTTPIISGCACLLLTALIFFQDGLGGAGKQLVVTALFPEQKKAIVFQEQVAKTGLLVRQQFSLSDDTYILPTFVSQNSSMLGTRYDIYDNLYSGDWFQSRTIQGHYIEQLIPSRERIELLNAADVQSGDGAPIVTISLNRGLDRLFLIDQKLGFWKASHLQVGAQATLEPASSEELTHWFDKLMKPAGPRLEATLREVSPFAKSSVQNQLPYFFAELGPNSVGTPTLKGIKWTVHKNVVFGPVVTK